MSNCFWSSQLTTISNDAWSDPTYVGISANAEMHSVQWDGVPTWDMAKGPRGFPFLKMLKVLFHISINRLIYNL